MPTCRRILQLLNIFLLEEIIRRERFTSALCRLENSNS